MRRIIKRTVTIVTTTTWTIQWQDEMAEREWPLPADCIPEAPDRLAAKAGPSLPEPGPDVAAKEGQLSNEVKELKRAHVNEQQD